MFKRLKEEHELEAIFIEQDVEACLPNGQVIPGVMEYGVTRDRMKFEFTPTDPDLSVDMDLVPMVRHTGDLKITKFRTTQETCWFRSYSILVNDFEPTRTLMAWEYKTELMTDGDLFGDFERLIDEQTPSVIGKLINQYVI